MTPYLEWLENTAISSTLRNSANLFLYPTILAFHTLGLAFFVGFSSAISLRILGVGREIPLAPLRKFYPIMWIGFLFNAASGLLLLIIEPTKFLTMFDFYVKIVAIAAAVYCNVVLYRRYFRHPPAVDPEVFPLRDRALAVTILVLWGASITAGRLTAYDDGFVQRETAYGTLMVSAALLVIGYIAVKIYRAIRKAVGGASVHAEPTVRSHTAVTH